MIVLKKLGVKKIAWGICGASHLLFETIDIIEKVVENGYFIDIFFSRAGYEVCKMFGVLKKLEILHERSINSIHLIYSDSQGYSFPICGKFSQHAYDIVIISPTTANTVAKLSYKIADTLITNIVSQALKGQIPVIIIPTDFRVGPCETIAPDLSKITITIHESDVERTNALKNIKGIQILESPKEISP